MQSCLNWQAQIRKSKSAKLNSLVHDAVPIATPFESE
jgi:hypothetical protein